MTLGEGDTAAIVAALFLLISEFLPFVSVVEGNGVVQIIAQLALRFSRARNTHTANTPQQPKE